jgi:putative membrane protein
MSSFIIARDRVMMTVSRSLLFLALAGVSSAAAAADADSAIPAPSSFVNMAAQAGMAEVEAGKVALARSARSQDPRIRDFAERMVADHGKANSELASLARARGIDTPTRLDADHRALIDSLQSKSGAEFDAAYARHMNMDHSKAIALFEGASKSTDTDVAGFARKTLPTLKEHKQLAARLPSAGDSVE